MGWIVVQTDPLQTIETLGTISPTNYLYALIGLAIAFLAMLLSLWYRSSQREGQLSVLIARQSVRTEERFDDMLRRYDALYAAHLDLTKRHGQTLQEVGLLQQANRAATQRYQTLSDELTALKIENGQLKDEIEKLKG